MNGCHVQPEQMFNLIWGYNGHFAQYLTHTKSGAGEYNMDFTSVPSDEVWMLQALAAADFHAVVRVVGSIETTGGVWAPVFDTDLVAATEYMCWTGAIVIPPLAFATISFKAVGNGHVVRGRICGYKMKLTQ